MEFENNVRRTVEVEHVRVGTPEQLFPLFCPVREYDWLDGWECEMVYSVSGFAEHGCVFRHDIGMGVETWVVSRYEPNHAISFVRVLEGFWTVLMETSLIPVSPTTTTVKVRYTFTALSQKGASILEEGKTLEAHRRRTNQLAAMTDHYLRTGKKLIQPETPTRP
jgi:hypothetical protein